MLSEIQEDKLTLKDHLTSLWRQSGVCPALEAAPNLPIGVRHLWTIFLDMHESRASDGFSIAKIKSGDMKDWCWMNGVELELWERKALCAIDKAWIKFKSKKP
jgi:hypothetical protein